MPPIVREMSRSVSPLARAAGVSRVSCSSKACCWQWRAAPADSPSPILASSYSATCQRSPRPRTGSEFTLDGTVFAYLAALCAGSAIVCSLVPAWHASRTNLAASLNDAGRASAGSRSRRRWTGAFVIAQVATALMLLTGAALTIQNLINAVRVDAGVETGGLMQMSIDLRRGDDTRERRFLFFSQLEERLAANPSANLTLASQVPLGGALVRRVRTEERPVSNEETLPLVSLVSVGEGYFDVVGARVIAGRTFTVDDLRRPGDGVVVSERFARMYFPNEPVVGKRVVLTEPNAPADASDAPRWTTIVGVVGNVRQRVLPSGEFDPSCINHTRRTLRK